MATFIMTKEKILHKAKSLRTIITQQKFRGTNIMKKQIAHNKHVHDRPLLRLGI
jgi:hypothetical protein